MDIFGFKPESVIARLRRSTNEVKFLTLTQSLLIGGLGFCLISLIVFATVAFGERWIYTRFTVYGAYGVWTALFILTGGGILSLLVVGPARLARFYLLFTVAFFLYALGWTVSWFAAGYTTGEWIGSLVGTLLMSLVLAWAFDAMKSFLKIALVLFVAHSAGYFAGSMLNDALRGRTGMMLWGAAYGLGTGLGLGYALYEAQAQVRALVNK